MMPQERKPKSHTDCALKEFKTVAGTIRAVKPRVLIPIAVLIVIAVVAFLTTKQTSSESATPVNRTPVPSGTAGVNLKIPERTLEGAVETPTPLANPHVAALIGSQVIARTAVKDNGYRLTLPTKLEDAALTGLEAMKLPNGEGRLKGDGVGAAVRFLVFDDANNNTQPDPDETSVDLAPFKAGQAEAMRGFFRYGLVIVSGNAILHETQDHPTGAKNFYRYDLKFTPGWHVIEGEFASQGYDIRESTGGKFDLIVPRAPSGKGPAGLEK
jgi:hypothetical protein